MKKTNLITKISLPIILFSLLIFTACTDDSSAIETEVSKDALAKLEKMHFDTSSAKSTHFMGEDGIAVEDMFFTLDQIDEMATDNAGLNTKQYRTTNLVSVRGSSRTITLSVDPDLGQIGSDALNGMITMYNNENLELNFVRIDFGGKGKKKANIVVSEFYELESGGFITLGRAAGFPTRRGNPAKGFGINSRWFDLLNPSLAEVTGTMAHEVGHCIGFRHTDYMTRESCGSNVNEGSAGVGAIHIAGTPTTSDASSLMQSCGPADSFNNNDKTALDVLY